MIEIHCHECPNWKKHAQRLPWSRYGRRMQIYWDCVDQSNCPKVAAKAEEIAIMRRFGGN